MAEKSVGQMVASKADKKDASWVLERADLSVAHLADKLVVHLVVEMVAMRVYFAAE
jgi:hypothetical protein